jgi:hypothetical protein
LAESLVSVAAVVGAMTLRNPVSECRPVITVWVADRLRFRSSALEFEQPQLAPVIVEDA